jgi:hypothetical protein
MRRWLVIADERMGRSEYRNCGIVVLLEGEVLRLEGSKEVRDK